MRATAFIVLLVALAGCRTASPPAQSIDGFPTHLAEPATSLPARSTPVANKTAKPSGDGTSPGATGSRTQETRPTATASSRPASFTQLGKTSDATGDHGPQVPGYADLVRLVIESDGTNARVTVTMGATVPNPMPADEQMAIGVDLYRSRSSQESDYQLYATGNADGWIAYLATPKGFVQYPGTFGLGGSRLVFTVPWSSLGSLRSGYASTFMDWDKEGVVLNQTGEDHAPDASKLRYA